MKLSWDGLPEGWPSDHGVATLGVEVLVWAESMLLQPDGETAGEPWRWTEQQARFILWWYAVDGDGRWLWNRGQVVLPKGAGKTPLAAALSLVELLGPCRFAGWLEPGVPKVKPVASPMVELAALSREQTGNTLVLIRQMVARGSEAARRYRGLYPQGWQVKAQNGLLKSVSASAKSAEGDRISSAFLDETHNWLVGNQMADLFATLKRNAGKVGGRLLETTNTWLSGQDSVAEKTFLDSQRSSDSDQGRDSVLRWHPSPKGFRAKDLLDSVKLRSALEVLYEGAPWIDLDRILEEIYDLGTDPAHALRFYLNIVSTDSTSWLDRADWDALRVEDVILPGDRVALGFDGSRGRHRGKPDATALVMVRVTDGLAESFKVWEASDLATSWEGWSPPIAEVEAAVKYIFDTFHVAAFYADPGKDWRAQVNQWEAEYGSKVQLSASRSHKFEWWMTGGRAGLVERAVEQVESAVINGDLSHTGSQVLTRHVLNAQRRISHGKLALGKDSSYSTRKIDAAVALVLAWQGRLDALAAGDAKQVEWVTPATVR